MAIGLKFLKELVEFIAVDEYIDVEKICEEIYTRYDLPSIDYTKRTVIQHLDYMRDKKLIAPNNKNNDYSYNYFNLTGEGQDFWNSIKDEDTWNIVVARINKIKGWNFPILKKVISDVLLTRLKE